MRLPGTLAAASAATWLLASAAAAQTSSPTGSVYGEVRDDSGSAVAGAAATLSGPGEKRSSESDLRGGFHFLGVSPGEYVLTVVRPGFETTHRELEVAPGRNAVVAITLAVAGAREAVTVAGGAPAFDRRQTDTGATYDSTELRTIPTTRDPWGILRQVPGVLLSTINVGDARSTSQPPFVGKGSHDDQNVYNVDGVTVSQFGTSALLYDFDSFDSVAVTTGGSDPAIATPGVTLNLVTKRGTNTILGSARGLYTDGAQWDYGVEAGGPVVTNRLWLWGAFARNAFLGETAILPDGETSRSQETQTYGNAKLNADLLGGNDLTLAYVNFERNADGRGASPMRSQPSTWNQTFPSQSYRIEDSQVFSANLFGSAYFSYLSGARNSTPQGGLDEQADYIDYVWQNSYAVQRQRFPQHQAGATVTSFFDTGALRHELKAGFGYRLAQFDSSSSWPGDLLVGDNTLDPVQASVTRPQNAKSQRHYYDTYVADTITTGRLTVSLGARFDYQQARGLASAVPANPAFPDLLPAATFPGDAGYPVTWREVQPRVGATYALGNEGATLLRASFARFANQLSVNEISTVSAFPGIATLSYGWNDTNGDGRVQPNEVDLPGGLLSWQNVDPTNPASSVPINRIASSLAPPTTDEFVVGIEHSLSSDLSASLDYTYRRAFNLEFSPLIGTTRADYQYAGNASGTAVDPSTGFVLAFNEPYYVLTSCPAPCSGTVLENRPDFSESYSGVELQVVKRMSHGWMLRVALAWNDWLQHVGVGAIVDPNNLVGGTNRSGPVVDAGINSQWQFNVSGAVEVPFGFLVAGNLYGRQGFPILYGVTAITNDQNPFSNPVLQIGAVGAYRLPDVVLLDLHVERSFTLGSTVTVTPMLDCFNVANSHTILGRDGNAGTFDATKTPALEPNPNFNAPGEQISDRLFRFGVRVTF